MNAIGEVRRVAAVGAGAAGLVAARELSKSGMEVVVFEASENVGGVWAHSDEVEDDLLGLSPTKRIHSSLYDSLRTNLPGKLMAFRDFPFDSSGGGGNDWPVFLGHEQVRLYLERFASAFDLKRWLRFGTRVECIQKVDAGGWCLRIEEGNEELFDAIVVCNGHYSKPRVPELAGIGNFRGDLYHSHNYRKNDAFRGKVVALLGVAASGVDIAREIEEVAERVIWCGDKFGEFESLGKTTKAPVPTGFDDEGRLCWKSDGEDERREEADAFMFCTGYHYDFPFLESGIVEATDNWVRPLYRDLVSAREPSLAFVGIPYSVIPFPLFEVQSKWLAALWRGKVELPAREEMLEREREREARLLRAGVKMRNFHKYGEEQYGYMDTFSREFGGDLLPDWFEGLAEEVRKRREENPGGYRDEEWGLTTREHKR